MSILVLLTTYRVLDDINQLVKHFYFGEWRASVSHDCMHAVSTLITATPPVGISPCHMIVIFHCVSLLQYLTYTIITYV